jgi:hypothetical protein
VEHDGSRWVVRVWLPDRPGALGAVASRIGAVRGDVIAVDVLERGGGRAVDEITVELDDDALVDLLVDEIGEVDGVDVEDVRPHHGDGTDRAVAALSVSRAIIEVGDVDDLHRVLCRDVRRLLGADWVAVVDLEHQQVVASAGTAVPDEGWLYAFMHASESEVGAVDELAYCPIDRVNPTSLVVARVRPPLRAVERSVIEELAGLAARRETDLAGSVRR